MADKRSNGGGPRHHPGRSPFNSQPRSGTEEAEWNSSRSATTRTDPDDGQPRDDIQSVQNDLSALAETGALFQSPRPSPRNTVTTPTQQSSSFASASDAADIPEGQGSATVSSQRPGTGPQNNERKRRGSTLDGTRPFRRSITGEEDTEVLGSPAPLSESDEDVNEDDSYTGDEGSTRWESPSSDEEGGEDDDGGDTRRSSTLRPRS